MIMQGLMMMVIGMGMVFVFFCIMMIVMNMLGVVFPIVEKFFPEPVVAAIPQKKSVVATNDASIALAIAAAKRFNN